MHGLFGVMTTTRPEVLIELQGQDSMSDVSLIISQVLKTKDQSFLYHMPRLDWQMWFEALTKD